MVNNDKVITSWREISDLAQAASNALGSVILHEKAAALTPDERDRRIRNYGMLCNLLVSLTDKDRDHWECATYSELLAGAKDAIEHERERVIAYATNGPAELIG